MPHLTNSDREKLADLAKQGNEDAIFFLGQSRQQQLRNYYRGWKILADQKDAGAVERLEEERERLRSNHVQRVAEIEAGCCDGDSEAFAKRDKHREGMRKRQQASRARKNTAKQPATGKKGKAAETEIDEEAEMNKVNEDNENAATWPVTRKKRKVAEPESYEAAGSTETTEDNDVGEKEQSKAPCDGSTCSECPVDDDEPLPTGNWPKVVKQEADDDDIIELPITKIPPWKTGLGPPIQTFIMEEEIELKLKKINAEIRQAVLEAKKASLELERLYLKEPRMV